MKKLKDIIKKNPEPAKGTNFVNPSQLGQYSATNQVAESASLNQYLQSKGINPEYVSKDTKIAHSKSNAYLAWKKAHMNEDRTLQPGPTEKKKSILSRAVASHKIVKTPPGPGYHREEGKGSQTPQLTPEETVNEVDISLLSPAKQAHVKKGRVATVNLGHASSQHKPKVKSTQPQKHGFLKKLFAGEEVVKKPMSTLDKFRQASAERAKKHAEIEKKQSKDGSGMTAAIDRLQKHLNKEDVSPLLKSIQKKSLNIQSKEIDKFIDKHKKSGLLSTKNEDVGDAKAAVNADGLPNPQLEPVSEKRKQMSKSARMIKALYKKKRMVKEDLYDHEKEDKSVVTYGKKPKHEKADEKDSKGEKKPQAAATLTGGTTLTGEKRDDIEIDPMMRNRPGQPDVTKKDDKDNKKEDKKKDK